MSWVTVVIIVVVAMIILLLWWWLSRRPGKIGAPDQPPSAATREALYATSEAPLVKEAERWAEMPPPTVEATQTAEATSPDAETERGTRVQTLAEAEPSVEATPTSETACPASDDLQVIEGIGPKIAAILQSHGITTFAQLAATDLGQLRDIMLAANLRIADPTTWPQQAALAAAGKWEELRALQDSLKGGRRA